MSAARLRPWMVGLASAQVIAISVLVFFMVRANADSSTPFDRLMMITQSDGALKAADLLGPGPIRAAVQICEAGHAPKGQICTPAAVRFALARRLARAQARQCTASRSETQLDGALRVEVSCEGALFVVHFDPAEDGLQGRPERAWPGFASGLN